MRAYRILTSNFKSLKIENNYWKNESNVKRTSDELSMIDDRTIVDRGHFVDIYCGSRISSYRKNRIFVSGHWSLVTGHWSFRISFADGRRQTAEVKRWELRNEKLEGRTKRQKDRPYSHSWYVSCFSREVITFSSIVNEIIIDHRSSAGIMIFRSRQRSTFLLGSLGPCPLWTVNELRVLELLFEVAVVCFGQFLW